jgi:autotransporter-associated beta strand protein
LLSFTTNNVFGNGVNNNNLPSVVLNDSTLDSTRYNVLGNVALNNATLTQTATDGGAYEGFQFRGNVSVTGSSVSTIATTNGKADHLGPNTIFDVGNVTATADTDLLISAPLRNQSGDFSQAVGGLTKNGLGTLEISSVSTYTGATIVNAGVLEVSGSITGSAVTVNADATLAGAGTIGSLAVVGGVISPGDSSDPVTTGTLNTGATSLDSNSTLVFELAQPGIVGCGINDLLSITGNFTLDGTFAVIDFPGFGNGSYRIANYSGGTFTNNGLDIDPSFLTAYPGSFVDTSTPGEVTLVVVPEPASATILLTGLGVVLAGRRSRKNRNA